VARRGRPAPLPVRAGLNPTRLQVTPGRWQDGGTVADFLAARFPDDEAQWRRSLADGDVLDELGRPVPSVAPAVPGSLLFVYRAAPDDEPVVPFGIDVLHEDEDLLVVDKPHFLATTPRGTNVVQTVLVRLRAELGLDGLSPAHRLDRLTAGVLVLTKRAEVRGAYQTLFQERAVTKLYEAVAPVRPDLELPRTVRSRIEKTPGVLAAVEVAGEPNAQTRVTLVRRWTTTAGEQHGLYRLEPRTGKTHQLRVHLASLGVPILGDDLYPTVVERARDDFSTPLQLLARSIRFADPFTGEAREFVSRRSLSAVGLGEAGAHAAERTSVRAKSSPM